MRRASSATVRGGGLYARPDNESKAIKKSGGQDCPNSKGASFTDRFHYLRNLAANRCRHRSKHIPKGWPTAVYLFYKWQQAAETIGLMAAPCKSAPGSTKRAVIVPLHGARTISYLFWLFRLAATSPAVLAAASA